MNVKFVMALFLALSGLIVAEQSIAKCVRPSGNCGGKGELSCSEYNRGYFDCLKDEENARAEAARQKQRQQMEAAKRQSNSAK